MATVIDVKKKVEDFHKVADKLSTDENSVIVDQSQMFQSLNLLSTELPPETMSKFQEMRKSFEDYLVKKAEFVSKLTSDLKPHLEKK